MSRSRLRIGEVAKLLGVTPKTIRHYHRRGLIPEPPRSDSDYRLYTANDLLRLRHIRQLQAMGLSLAQIKTIFDAPQPDTHLQVTLNRLRADLQAEQARLTERIQQVETYLAEEASLAEVVSPASPSPTYERLVKHLSSDVSMSDAIKAFDQRVFAELDSFDWGSGYSKIWATTAELISDNPSLRDFMLWAAQRMEAIVDLPPDSPELEHWAEEFARSPQLQQVGAVFANLETISTPLNEAMGDLISAASAAQLSPAQQRLFELIAKNLRQ